MTPEQVAELGTALPGYLGEYRECFERRPVFENFETYCRGLLGGEGRKSVEPMALAAGAGVRAMQLFLSGMKWDERKMRDLAQGKVAAFAAAHAPAGGSGGRARRLAPGEVGEVGLVDETAFPKKGKKTPGVQRQWCGALGKKENCVVTVHLGHWQEPTGLLSMLDSELFLPDSWAKDRERCNAAAIPDSMAHRTKPRIAAELVKRALGNGVHFDFLTYDETYGRDPQFLLDLGEMGQVGVGEVPSNFRCLASLPKGRKQDPKDLVGQEVYDVARWSKPFVYQQWVQFKVERETVGPQVWDVKAARVHLLRDGKPLAEMFWLLVAWNRKTDEYKYFFSNAPASTPLQTLVAVAFKRAHVEHLFRVLKSEVGFGHYEGRSYKGMMRHLTLCQVLLLFLALQAAGLRGEKRKPAHPARDDGAGRPRPQRPVPTLARPAPRAPAEPAHLLRPDLHPAA